MPVSSVKGPKRESGRPVDLKAGIFLPRLLTARQYEGDHFRIGIRAIRIEPEHLRQSACQIRPQRRLVG
jgi:hypothetical protein